MFLYAQEAIFCQISLNLIDRIKSYDRDLKCILYHVYL
jgi:hypothetical protein